ncbi:hypothetical protein BGP79_08965 [Tersicoccus sp. Bi-70]|nr:hypothetical protein BGP79_08965 [Tersicoccus sp. Bi-70]
MPAAQAGPGDYPSWDQVRRARHTEADKVHEIGVVSTLLDRQETEAARAADIAVQRLAEQALAQQAADAARFTAEVVGQRRDEAVRQLASSSRMVGVLASAAWRNAGTASLLLVPANLEQARELGILRVVLSRTGRTVEDYRSRRNTLAAMESQAAAAQQVRDRTAEKARQALAAAIAAQQDAQRIVVAQQTHRTELYAQLALLKGTTARAEITYRDGVRRAEAYRAAQAAARAEAARRAREEAARQAAELAAQRAAQQAAAQQAAAQQQAAQQAAQQQAAQQAAQQQAAQQAAQQQAAQQAAQQQAAQQQAAQRQAARQVSPVAVPAPAPAAPAPSPVTSAEPALLTTTPTGAVNDPAGAQAWAASRLGAHGWGQDQMSCLVPLWDRESGWQTTATNPSSLAYGIPQSLPASKLASAGADWLTNYRTQVDWGLGYIADRYGSPCGAWGHEQSAGWY